MTNPEHPKHASDMFCHAVYTASHAINRAYAPHLKKLNLTYPQYITLTLLWERDGQKISELAAQLNMETSTLTPLVKRLEALGHVIRKKGAQDGREVFAITLRSVQRRRKHSLIQVHRENLPAIRKPDLSVRGASFIAFAVNFTPT